MSMRQKIPKMLLQLNYLMRVHARKNHWQSLNSFAGNGSVCIYMDVKKETKGPANTIALRLAARNLTTKERLFLLCAGEFMLPVLVIIMDPALMIKYYTNVLPDSSFNGYLTFIH